MRYELHGLNEHQDERGWLTEFVKFPDAGQVIVSRTKPGVTRGNHWHRTKVEKFLVVEGRATIKLRKVGGSRVLPCYVSGEHPTVLEIPPGYVHSLTNEGARDLITVIWASEVFDPEHPDTYAESV